ncbi:MAG: diadenylate cyclase CdaA [Sphaerochaetaceae bacterium]|jgi:diadenylate cyclase|nr:diadenylate cyclase CdaA [Sphaerochaetaceae bacterium]NLV83574.1 TIGR00159 family protein [Spirochaetales bacterium]
MSKIWNILGPVVEIGILTYVFYRFYTAVAQTKAQQIFKIIFVLLAVYAIAYITHLQTFLWLYKQMAVPIVIFICVVYQPELRRAFTQLFSGRSRIFRIGVQTTAEQIDSILNACTVLVSKNRGALIVFTRHLGIKNIIDSGTKLNADLSSALILTVFDHDTPLHDGAMVIQGNKIVAAGCYLPLSEQTDIKKSFGTRHRAALGLAEESDAIVLVVSEETGAISLTYNANLYYDLDTATIKRMLLALFSYHDVTPQDLTEAAPDETE